MVRPRKAIPSVKSDLYLPEDLDAQIRVLLWSKAENRVPYGAWSAFFEKLAREALARIPQQQGTLP